MPELPEVEAVRRRLQPAMKGAHIDRVRLGRADLRRPFPPDFARRLEGRLVRAVDRRGKQIQCTITCSSLVGTDGQIDGVILLMTDGPGESGGGN